MSGASDHTINAQAVVKQRQSDGTDAVRALQGTLVVGIRVDELPAGEAQRLAAEGKFYPLTTDQDGNLRVALPGAVSIEATQLAVLREIRDLLTETRDLLMEIA